MLVLVLLLAVTYAHQQVCQSGPQCGQQCSCDFDCAGEVLVPFAATSMVRGMCFYDTPCGLAILTNPNPNGTCAIISLQCPHDIITIIPDTNCSQVPHTGCKCHQRSTTCECECDQFQDHHCGGHDPKCLRCNGGSDCGHACRHHNDCSEDVFFTQVAPVSVIGDTLVCNAIVSPGCRIVGAVGLVFNNESCMFDVRCSFAPTLPGVQNFTIQGFAVPRSGICGTLVNPNSGCTLNTSFFTMDSCANVYSCIPQDTECSCREPRCAIETSTVCVSGPHICGSCASDVICSSPIRVPFAPLPDPTTPENSCHPLTPPKGCWIKPQTFYNPSLRTCVPGAIECNMLTDRTITESLYINTDLLAATTSCNDINGVTFASGSSLQPLPTLINPAVLAQLNLELLLDVDGRCSFIASEITSFGESFCKIIAECSVNQNLCLETGACSVSIV